MTDLKLLGANTLCPACASCQRGSISFAWKADDDEEELSWTFLVGFDIVEAKTNKKVGTIASIDDSTANLLFELEDGRLIPASEELITDIDKEKNTITIDLPDGILDL